MDTNKTTLCVLAAGMGSRFGGLKQIEPIGPNNEVILDYSVYDAISAGFNKVVFIIKKEIEKDFRDAVGKRIEKKVEVDYAFQDISQIPAPFKLPDERIKPWGTGHAVLSAENEIKTPFAVINADDYYGKEAYVKIHNHLIGNTNDYAMVGYFLKNTVTEHGSVARGVCEVSDGYLKNIVERTNIKGLKYSLDNENWVDLSSDTIVSMNFWGFDLGIFDFLKEDFALFLKENINNPKSEYFLPIIIDKLIKNKNKKVKVLETNDKWYGVTYKEDKESVKAALLRFTKDGLYEGI